MLYPSDVQLGNLIQSHRISYARLLIKLLMALLVLVISGLSGDGLMWFVFVIVFPYLVFKPIVRLVKRPHIEVYENGIVTKDHTWYWREIDGLSRTYLFDVQVVFHVGAYRLHCGNEKVLSIDYDFVRTEKLFSVIGVKTAEVLFPIYLAELNRTGNVIFGKIALTKQSISNGRMTLDWADISEANLFSNQLRIFRHRGAVVDLIPAMAVSIAYLKNYHILLLLINYLAGESKNAA